MSKKHKISVDNHLPIVVRYFAWLTSGHGSDGFYKKPKIPETLEIPRFCGRGGMADAPDLGSGALWRKSSSLFVRTNIIILRSVR